MRVTVCELPDERQAFEKAWDALVAYVRTQQSELVLLPELPFSAWFALAPQFDAQVWQQAQDEHDLLLDRLTQLAPAIVLSTRLVTEEGKHLNRGYSWTPAAGYKGVHDKYYLPDEEGFYEARWFERGQRDFKVTQVEKLTVGFMICSELMFNEWARAYGKQGANIIAVPRAATDTARWQVACRMAAIASGAFVLSSNRVGESLFAGKGWVIGPDGDVLAATSRQNPFATVEIDLEESARAKLTYPRDLKE